jgi:hypothetical protein
MEALLKRDLLNLAGDPFIKSILAPDGKDIADNLFRGDLSLLSYHKV